MRKAKSNTLLTHSLIYQGIVFVREAISSKQNPRYCTRKARERYEIQNAIEEISKGALDTTLNVDDFQGQERDVIFISLVRANEDGQIGFLNDLRRMNVAITRARMKLVILGDASTLTKHPFYKRLMLFIKKED